MLTSPGPPSPPPCPYKYRDLVDVWEGTHYGVPDEYSSPFTGRFFGVSKDSPLIWLVKNQSLSQRGKPREVSWSAVSPLNLIGINNPPASHPAVSRMVRMAPGDRKRLQRSACVHLNAELEQIVTETNELKKQIVAQDALRALADNNLKRH